MAGVYKLCTTKIFLIDDSLKNIAFEYKRKKLITKN